MLRTASFLIGYAVKHVYCVLINPNSDKDNCLNIMSTILSSLSNHTTIEQILPILLASPNALSYNSKELLDNYTEGVSEIKALGLYLCGTSGYRLVESFINGKSEKEFIANIQFNSDNSIPLIIRVINLRLSNRCEVCKAQ